MCVCEGGEEEAIINGETMNTAPGIQPSLVEVALNQCVTTYWATMAPLSVGQMRS